MDVGHIGADDVSAGTDDRVIVLFLITESSVGGWSEGRVGLGGWS